MKVLNYLLLIISLFFSCNVHAEARIEELRGQNVKDMLLEHFIGSGVEIANAKFNGQSVISNNEGKQIAIFNNESDCDKLEIKKGIMLATDACSKIITSESMSILSAFNISAEDLHEYANGYLPSLYQEKLKNYYDYIRIYRLYDKEGKVDYDENPSLYSIEGITKTEFNEMKKIINSDPVFFDLLDYEGYYGDSYNSTLSDYFELYSVYKLVSSLEQKYYIANAVELETLQLKMQSYDFTEKFYAYYMNAKPIAYDPNKNAIFKKIYEETSYNNKMNIIVDKDLKEMTNSVVNSPAILEFDFTTTDDSIAFNYTFASQEYPDYVGSIYNDAFAFIITDQTTGKSENIALIPGTTNFVSINNVNAYNNSNYFIKNYLCEGGPCDDNDCNILMGGFTTLLTARAQVVPCRQYHLKMAIGNLMDYQLQSSVYLEAGSFKSNGISSKTRYSNINARGIANECSNGELIINIKDSDSPTKIKIKHIGEAKNGIDYKEIPENITVPAHTDSIKFDLIPLKHIKKDSMEIVMVLETESSCSTLEGDTIHVFIYNSSPITITANEAKCCATELSVEHTGPITNITWEPAYLLKDNKGFVVNPLSCPDEDVKFTITAQNIFGCNKVTETIILSPCTSELGMSAELVTNNNSSELIANCNEGNIIININRDTKNKEDVMLEFSYGNGTNLVGLPKQLTIPMGKTSFELPVKALKGSSAYHNEFEVVIDCKNCNIEPTSTTLEMSTTQLKPIALEKDLVYSDCEVGGLNIEVPLLSGSLGEVTWEPTDYLASIEKLSATIADDLDSSIVYTVKATDSTGCQETETKVSVIKKICLDLIVPPFFTPNNDGINEVWKVYGLEQTEKSTVKIFDRWGKLLYEFNPNEGYWDGTYNETSCPTDDYWYVIDCEELDKVYTGHFTLLRN